MTAAVHAPALALSVSAAFAGKRVLVTGATGFVGKVVLEKLMREMAGIGSIVLLMRGNRAHPDASARFRAEVLGSSIFSRLREQDPMRLQSFVQHKVRIVPGEIADTDLGLTPADFLRLAREVDVIVNVAASVDFREALDKALAINTMAVSSLTKLARAAGGIPLVQVSTCYVNGYRRGMIDESIDAPEELGLPRNAHGYFEVDALLARLEKAVAAVKQRVTEPTARSRELVALGIREARKHGWNDTYTFTKWLGEQVACRGTAGGTLTIVRPAIVESALCDPEPGWIEGMKVGDAIVLAYARGKTSFFPGRPSGVVDVIPVDLVASSIILATAEALASPGERRVYQASSSTRNPILVGEFARLVQTEMRSNSGAYPKLIRKPLTRPFRIVPRGLFMACLGVAYAATSVANCVARQLGTRRKLGLHDAVDTTRQLATTFSFYSSPRCVFENRRLLEMARRFDHDERQRFALDPRSIDWEHYVTRVHLQGLERFAFKPSLTRPAPVETSSSAVRLPGVAS